VELGIAAAQDPDRDARFRELAGPRVEHRLLLTLLAAPARSLARGETVRRGGVA
jgi:hypothetical protein